MITNTLRLLLFLGLVGVTTPAIAEPVRGQAVGPRSMRPRTHRATVLRPEDEPPSLPTSTSGVEGRRGSTVRLMTFEDLPRQSVETRPRSFASPSPKAKQPATRSPTQSSPQVLSPAQPLAEPSLTEPPLTEPLPLELPSFESPSIPSSSIPSPAPQEASPGEKKGADKPVDNDFLKFDSPSEPFAISAPPATPRPIMPSDPPRVPAVTPSTPGESQDTIRTLGSPSPSSSSFRATAPKESTSFVDLSWLPEGSATLSTTGSAVALAVGLLLLMCAVLRKAMPRSARPLPEDVISLLGRVTLANKQSAQLMKVGSKLVLVAMTPDGAKPITEINDPEEVARLLGLIEQANPAGASAAFREVFDQVARESTPSGFLGDDLPPFGPAPTIDRSQVAAAYSQTSEGRRYAA